MIWLKDKFSTLLAFLLIGVVQFYRVVISSITPGTCRYSPTCSCYAIDALKNHGLLQGGWLSLRRMARCNPWGGWGYDPVPPPAQAHPTQAHPIQAHPTQAHTKYNLKVQENP